MFIYTVRGRTVKFVMILVLMVVLTVLVGVLGGGESLLVSASAAEIDYSEIKTNEDRVRFIESFGIEVEDEAVDEKSFTMPEKFDRVILGYNELQKKQGLDLSKYAKKKVQRYTYLVTNYDDEGTVYANIFVWRGRVVACDISSANPEGFVLPLTLVDKSKLK